MIVGSLKMDITLKNVEIILLNMNGDYNYVD